MDQEALLSYAREAADFSTQQQLPSLDFAINHYGQPDVAMFDFTCMYASENAALVREHGGHQLLVALVGDSLLEVSAEQREVAVRVGGLARGHHTEGQLWGPSWGASVCTATRSSVQGRAPGHGEPRLATVGVSSEGFVTCPSAGCEVGKGRAGYSCSSTANSFSPP